MIRALACTHRVAGLIPSQGHLPGLEVQSLPPAGGVQEATNRLSLPPPSLPLSRLNGKNILTPQVKIKNKKRPK